MPLSNDPQKRARQLQNLSKGGQVAAERHSFPAGHGAQGDPATPALAGHETAGGEDRRGQLPVVGYGTSVPPDPTPEEQPAAESRAAAGTIDTEPPDHHDHDEVDDEVDDEPAGDRGGLGGLWDGFLGR